MVLTHSHLAVKNWDQSTESKAEKLLQPGAAQQALSLCGINKAIGAAGPAEFRGCMMGLMWDVYLMGIHMIYLYIIYIMYIYIYYIYTNVYYIYTMI